MSKSLVLKNICKSFGSLMAVDNVSLTVEPGEFICFLGPSGCGKTTLLRIITGFEFQTSGDISYGEKNLNNVIPQKRDFGIVFQSYALFPNMTVQQNIAFGLKMRKMPQKLIDKRVDEMLELMGLTEWKRHYPSQLSGGQQQRVALARAIAIKPNVLLLDEPLSALDAKIRVRLRAVIKRLQQDLGITMIYVTHDQEEALSMADRVVVMRDGQLRQVGSPWDIYKKPRTSFIAEFVGTSNFFAGQKNGNRVSYGKFSFEVTDMDKVEGDKIYLAIRPEDIEIVGRTIASDDCIPSNIVDVQADLITFLGAVVSITVNLEGQELIVDIAQKEFAKQPVTEKETIHLYFPPEAFHVYSEIFKKLI
jgi:iron(III) transport system ATP-binding protein